MSGGELEKVATTLLAHLLEELEATLGAA